MSNVEKSVGGGRRARDPFDRFSFFWPFGASGERYLNSDFMANYARGYVWSANQFGHFTIGLLTALSYVWTLDVLVRLLQASDAMQIVFGGREGGVGGFFQAFRSDLAEQPALMVMSVALGLALVVGFLILIVRVATRRLPLNALRAARARRAEATGRAASESHLLIDASSGRLWGEAALRVALVASLLAMLAALAAVAGEELSSSAIRGAYLWRAELVATAFATLFFAAVAAALSHSSLHTALSWTALAIAGVIWSAERAQVGLFQDVAPAPPEALAALFGDREPLIYLLALFIALLAALALRPAGFRRTGREPAPLFLGAIAIGVVGLGLLTVIEPPMEPFWPGAGAAIDNAVAAVIAALAVWWVKEFGADLRWAELEIDLAHERRLRNGHPTRVGDVDLIEDLRPSQEACRADAQADSRTDALFYLLGALLAGAIIASPGVFTDSLWRSAFPTLAAIGFLIVYIVVGWRWMRRADCLDRVAVLAAQRLAMIESAVSVKFLYGSDPLVEPLSGPSTPPGPFERLNAFARGRLELPAADDGPGFPVRHLVICGHVGSGRSALGHAIACEATLDSTPPPFLSGASRRPLGSIRRARFVLMRDVYERHLFLGRTVLRKEDLATDAEADHEAADVADRVGKQDVFVIDEADPLVAETRIAYRIAGARPGAEPLRVYDEIRDAARADRVGAIADALALLRVDLHGPAPDLTVWIVPADVDEPSAEPDAAVWDPEIPQSALGFAADLRQALVWEAERRAAATLASGGVGPAIPPDALQADQLIVGVAMVARARRRRSAAAARLRRA